MVVLVANLGSTSFKYKLYDVTDDADALLAQGGADRIGQGDSRWSFRAGDHEANGARDLADHGEAIDLFLAQIGERKPDAIGFKAVHGGPIRGAVRVDEGVLDTMRQFSDVAPAHNPPYIAAMRSFAEKLPGVPQVAAFETAFHQTIPLARQVYGTPYEWVEWGVRRYGFHGASNAYVARRMKQLDPSATRVINLHLGGSCSVCAIRDGKSVAHSMGTTPQTGLFHANRNGDFDTFALLKLRAAGLSIEDIFARLGREGGLLGLSGVSADMRLVKQAADAGNERAQLAIDAFVESCRHYLGAFLVALGGADAIVFTAGIGQYCPWLRDAVLRDLDFLGLKLDPRKNDRATDEVRITTDDSNVNVWVLPTNEELIVARQTYEVLTRN